MFQNRRDRCRCQIAAETPLLRQRAEDCKFKDGVQTQACSAPRQRTTLGTKMPRPQGTPPLKALPVAPGTFHLPVSLQTFVLSWSLEGGIIKDQTEAKDTRITLPRHPVSFFLLDQGPVSTMSTSSGGGVCQAQTKSPRPGKEKSMGHSRGRAETSSQAGVFHSSASLSAALGCLSSPARLLSPIPRPIGRQEE
ncbi:uncharacterized protein LOC119513527 isoform X2 [Choloepus didactylus]|uniref:uncharacterized protein LOC119513527 isoform X2 n=1 Tax=Choloepus didactylus TaxID=27675 RepID=UPI00189FDF4C|nr:uncharacterized protein LOC119513527 isoform X2 [Choloepus didactylus]